MSINYIQVPHTVSFGATTHSLIVVILYFFILATFIIIGKKRNTLKVGLFSSSKFTREKKKKLIFSVAIYAILVLFCINLSTSLDSESTILKIAKTYLQYEVLIFAGLLLFLCTSFFNTVNRDTQIIVSTNIFQYVIWISVGTGLLVGQIDYAFCQNKLIIVSVAILNIIIKIVDIKSIDKAVNKPSQFDLISYNPVQNIDELFPQHKEEAENIVNIISNSSSEPFSICLSGEWGTGKTSVINGVINALEDSEDKLFEFIYINALEIDSKQNMLHYLMTQIKEKLKSHNVYVGFDSEYKEFIASTAGNLTIGAIGTFIQKKFSHGDDDYRQQKKQLEEVIKRTFKDGKLIVIVDDIERCDKKIAREYLFLIKEVATMHNCVSIFVTDYDMLNEIVSCEKISTDSNDFLSKFFNYRVNLHKEMPENIFNFYDKYFNEDDPAFWSIYRIICMSPGTWYNNVTSIIISKIKDLEKQRDNNLLSTDKNTVLDENINQLNECLSLFTNLMQNPRNIVKFYNVFRNHAHNCVQQFLSSSSTNDEVNKYIDSRNIGQILYVLSFTEVCMPYEYQQLLIHGSKHTERPLDNENIEISLERRLLIELTKSMIMGEYFDFQKTTLYIKEDILRFIDAFLNQKRDIAQLVNVFTSREEKWINAINNWDEQLIKSQWDDIILMILQKSPNNNSKITNTWRNESFLKLLKIAEQQVKNGVWTTDKIFSIFDCERHADRFLATGTGLLQIFWEHLNNSTSYSKPSPKISKDMIVFSHHYAYVRIGSIYRLAHYLIPFDARNDKPEDWQEYLLNSNKHFTENISTVLDKIAILISDLSVSKCEWYEKFKIISTALKEYLKNNGLDNYDDVKIEIEHMIDSAEEFRCLEQIIVWAQCDNHANPQMPFQEINSNNIDKMITYFDDAFNSQSLDDKMINIMNNQFSEFFKKLKNNQNIVLTEQQIRSLHELISRFIELSGYSGLPYRRVLVRISQNNKAL